MTDDFFLTQNQHRMISDTEDWLMKISIKGINYILYILNILKQKIIT